jgi:uncharacterized Zn-binding protein involved in type VI secretion
MTKQAARKTDPVSHGGKVLTGSSDVVTVGQPSARLGDLVVCELHGAALVDETSRTVFVNGKGFARQTDGCRCAGGGGTVGPGQAELIDLVLAAKGGDQTIEEVLAERNGYGLMAQALITDENFDGKLDTLTARGAMAGIELTGEHGSWSVEALGGEFEAALVEGEGAITGAPGLNRTVKVKGSLVALQSTGEARSEEAHV